MTDEKKKQIGQRMLARLARLTSNPDMKADELNAIIDGCIEDIKSYIPQIDKGECICTVECLGCYHKGRKCKKLKGYTS